MGGEGSKGEDREKNGEGDSSTLFVFIDILEH